jgi:hypothetical protein
MSAFFSDFSLMRSTVDDFVDGKSATNIMNTAQQARILPFFSILAALFAIRANAATVQLGETTSANFWPFAADDSGVFPFGSSATHRFQLAYESSLFSDVNGPIRISAISFIAGNQFTFPISYSNSSMSIKLASSPLDAFAQSTNFESNLGSDALMVYDGQVLLAASSVGDLATINFSNVFVFDPTLGFDFVVDILPKGVASGVFSSAGPRAFSFSDGVPFPGEDSGFVFRTYSTTSTTTAFSTTLESSSAGISAVITYEAVPEPSSSLFLGFSIFLTVYRRRVRCEE